LRLVQDQIKEVVLGVGMMMGLEDRVLEIFRKDILRVIRVVGVTLVI
jgi:hypothetical protein